MGRFRLHAHRGQHGGVRVPVARLGAVALGCVLVGGLASPLRAAPAATSEPATSAEAPEHTVVVFGDLSDPDVADAWSAIDDHLAPYGFGRRVEAVPRDQSHAQRAKAMAIEDPSLLAVYWWTVDATGLQLFAYDARRGVFLTRRIDIDPGEGAASLESLGVIVETVSEALVYGEGPAMAEATEAELQRAQAVLDERRSAQGDVGPATEAPVEAGPASTTEPEPRGTDTSRNPERDPVRRRPPGWLGAHYVGEVLAADAPWNSGLGLRGGLEPSPRVTRGLFVEAGYDYAVPVRFAAEPLASSGQSDRHLLGLWLGYALAVGRSRLDTDAPARFGLEFRAQLGAQIELWRYRVAENRGSVPRPRGHLELGLRGGLGRVAFWQFGAFVASGFQGADLVICEAETASCRGEARRRLLSPYPVRGGLRAGLGASF